MRVWLAILATAFWVLSGEALHAASVRNMIILDYHDSTQAGNYGDMAQQVPILLSNCFANYSDRIAVVERDAILQLSREKALQKQGLAGSTEAISLELPPADFILQGHLQIQDNTLAVTSQLHDRHTTRLLHSETVQGNAGKIASWLCGSAAGIAQFIGQFEVMEQLPADGQARLHQQLNKGLGYYYLGQYRQAQSVFLKIMNRHPGHADAAYWLVKSFFMTGQKPLFKTQAKAFLARYPADNRVQEIVALMEGNGDQTEKGK